MHAETNQTFASAKTFPGHSLYDAGFMLAQRADEYDLPPPKAENKVLWVRLVGFFPVLVHEPLRVEQLCFWIHLLIPGHGPGSNDIRTKIGGYSGISADQTFGIIIVSAGISYPLYWSSFIDR